MRIILIIIFLAAGQWLYAAGDSIDHNRAGVFVGIGRYDASLFASGLRYQYFITPEKHSFGLGAETNMLFGDDFSWQLFGQAILKFRSGIKLWVAPGYLDRGYSSFFHRNDAAKKDRPQFLESGKNEDEHYAIEIGASAEIRYSDVLFEPTARISFYGAAYIIFGMTVNYTF
jgi:hypothetical protein